MEKERKQKGSTLPKKNIDTEDDWSDNKKNKKKGGKGNTAKGGKSKNVDEGKVGGMLSGIDLEVVRCLTLSNRFRTLTNG